MKDLKDLKQYKEITIYIDSNISMETLIYINDCWIRFITEDLGLMPNQGIMVLPM